MEEPASARPNKYQSNPPPIRNKPSANQSMNDAATEEKRPPRPTRSFPSAYHWAKHQGPAPNCLHRQSQPAVPAPNNAESIQKPASPSKLRPYPRLLYSAPHRLPCVLSDQQQIMENKNSDPHQVKSLSCPASSAPASLANAPHASCPEYAAKLGPPNNEAPRCTAKASRES